MGTSGTPIEYVGPLILFTDECVRLLTQI